MFSVHMEGIVFFPVVLLLLGRTGEEFLGFFEHGPEKSLVLQFSILFLQSQEKLFWEGFGGCGFLCFFVFWFFLFF